MAREIEIKKIKVKFIGYRKKNSEMVGY